MAGKFAPILSQLRKERNISQKKAAADLGVSQALLSHYEKGIRECGLDFVIRCAEYYSVTTDYLLGISSSRNGISEDYFEKYNISAADDPMNIQTLSQATKILLDTASVSSDKNYIKNVYEYYMLSIYRAAVTAGKAGTLPKEMFKLDYAVSRELANAAIAIKDAQFALREDRSRSGQDLSKRTALHVLIERAEDYILTNFILE